MSVRATIREAVRKRANSIQGHFILDLGDEFRWFQPSKTKIADAWNSAFSWMHKMSKFRMKQPCNSICEYCHSSEEGSTGRFTMDHLLPQSLGGRDEINLTLACTRCNGRRYNFIDGFDLET